MAVQIEDEIMVIQAVNASSGEIMIASTTDTVNPWTGAAVTATAGRGRFGTQDAFHVAGSGIKFFNFRPDDLYADQIASQDVLDLRRGITPGSGLTKTYSSTISVASSMDHCGPLTSRAVEPTLRASRSSR